MASSENNLDPTGRFSSRVADYARYRPDYPRQIIPAIGEIVGFSSAWLVADVGCGTGISARMFLENGNEVYGIEPNDDMRAEAERQFAGSARFHPVKAAAEATTLPEASVDLVVAAQAFHWFDHAACAVEWRRVLRGGAGGYVLLMWNTRLVGVSSFATEYDQLLHRLGTDYNQVAHRTPVSMQALAERFDTSFQRLALPNAQVFDYESLCGRVRSSSYTPLPGQAGHDELFAGVRELFARHQRGGMVQFDYETEVYIGRLSNRRSRS